MQVTPVHRTVGNKNTTSYVLVGKYTEARLCCQCARKESAQYTYTVKCSGTIMMTPSLRALIHSASLIHSVTDSVNKNVHQILISV